MTPEAEQFIKNLVKNENFINELKENVKKYQKLCYELNDEKLELQAQIEKMKCCENCVRHRKRTCDEDKKFFARASRNCNEWELAE